jgi:tetratricopeptide (TPR) repeat protein
MCARILFSICVAAAVCRLAGQSPSPDSSEIRDHAQRARLALARNDLNSAEREYREILRLEPQNADAYSALGVALYGSGDLPEAAKALNNSLELDKSQKRAELFLGLTESDLGRCDKALPLLAVHFSSESETRLRRLAGLSMLNCQLAGGDTAHAEQSVERLKDLYPDDADVLYKAAELYTRLWNDAAGKLMQAHPESYRVHELAGEVFAAQGNDDRAIKEFRMALEKNPRIPQVHFRIAQLLLKQDDAQARDRALDEYRQELAVAPQSAAAENAIGDIYREQQKLEDAAQHYRRAVVIDPGSAEAHIGLAQIWLAQRDPERARQELEIAIGLQPDNAPAHYNLMLAYRSQGRLADASREMEAFQKLQEQESRQFENKLHSLLTGQAASAAQK